MKCYQVGGLLLNRCVGGGGSPRPKGKKGIDERIDATYEIDENSKTRTSTENSQLNQLYEEDLGGEYGSHEAHHLLHTYFTNRQVDKTWAIFFKQILGCFHRSRKTAEGQDSVS